MDLGKTLLIANPAAQSGAGEEAAQQAEALMRKRLSQGPDVVRTSYPGHASSLAQTLGTDYDTVVALGGDGVLHEVVQGLMSLEPKQRPALGLIPVGSGNDYAKSLGMSEKISQAVTQLFDYEALWADVGRVNDQYFAQTLSFGLDAAIALGTVQRRQRKGKSGFMLYLEEGFHQLFHNLSFYPFTLSGMKGADEGLEDLSGQAVLVAVQVGPTYGGGFKICPKACLDDGVLDLCVALGPISVPTALKVFVSAKDGHHVNHRAMRFRQLTKASLVFEGCEPQCQIDGEEYKADRFDIEVVPRALRVIRAGETS